MDHRLSRNRHESKKPSGRKRKKVRTALSLNVSSEKLKRSLATKDCHFGIVDTRKFKGITVTCDKFSIIFKIKNQFLTLFVDSKSIFVLDSKGLLLTKNFPEPVYQFINSLAAKRKMILTKLKASVKCILKICFQFLVLLYKNSSVDTIISLLNLIIL